MELDLTRATWQMMKSLQTWLLWLFSDSEVHNDKTCSKTCPKRFETLKTQLDDLRIEFNKSESNLTTYKRGLASVEEQLIFYKKNEVIFYEQLAVLKRDISYKDSEISMLKSEVIFTLNLDLSYSGLEEFQQPEFEGYGHKSSKSVSEDISNEVRKSPDAPLIKELVSDDKFEKKTVFPTVAKIELLVLSVKVLTMYRLTAIIIKGKGWNMVLRAVLMKTGLRSLNTARPVNTAHPKTTVYSARPISHFSKSAQSTVKRPYQTRSALTNKNFSQKVNTAKGNFYTARPNSAVVNAVRENQGHPQKEDLGYVDSGFSRHMIENMSYLPDFKKFDGGYVTFGGGARGKLLNSVLFTDTGCFVLSPDFKLGDESQVLLKVPRKNNMYSVDMKNSVPKESLTCLVAKATLDESMLWHRRLGHVNFKTINKLVKENLVRGLPSKRFENDQTYVAYLKGKQHKASCTNSNDFAGSEESNGAGHTSKETKFSQDYIVMPLWKDGSMFDSSSKNSSDDEPQPSSNVEKKDDEGVSKASRFSDQEQPESSTPNINTVGPSINTASANFKTGSLNINTVSPTVITTRSNRSQNVSDMFSLGRSATLEATHADLFGDETEMDMSNLTTSYQVPTTPNTRIHKDHSLDHVIGDIQSGVQTRGMTKNTNEHGFISAVYEGKTHEDLHTCLFACFLSQEEPKRIAKALSDPAWVEAMQEELLQFKLQKVWILVDLPKGKRAIGTKWIFRNKKDERGIVTRNKARLVAQGYTQEEGIDYDEVFAHVARIKAIRLFLAYASFIGFMVYQMDVKSAFLYGTIKEEVHVCQPPGFEDPDYLDKVYKVVKAVYVDDIIFGSTNNKLCTEFEKQMHDKFQMSSMGELNFFLGFQVKQREYGIFISQDKYVAEILRKFGFTDVKTTSTLMDTEKPLLKDSDGDDVDVHLYRSMIGSLMYLTSSRPDIMFACKKKIVVATSFTEAEYVAAASCCGQVLWIQNQMLDYGYNYMHTMIDVENNRTICIVKNPVSHTKTKHIEIRYHFIRDCYDKKLIQVVKIHTDHNFADLLTKALDVGWFRYLVASIGMLNP
ncbi:putative ribonuclease H-like domain-containing protein [Tanacetum coccineum]